MSLSDYLIKAGGSAPVTPIAPSTVGNLASYVSKSKSPYTAPDISSLPAMNENISPENVPQVQQSQGLFSKTLSSIGSELSSFWKSIPAASNEFGNQVAGTEESLAGGLEKGFGDFVDFLGKGSNLIGGNIANGLDKVLPGPSQKQELQDSETHGMDAFKTATAQNESDTQHIATDLGTNPKLQSGAESFGEFAGNQGIPLLLSDGMVDVLGSGLAKIPVANEILQVIKDASSPTSSFIQRYGITGARSALTGAISSIAIDNKKSIAQNALDTAGDFAAFHAIAYPLAELFRPIFKSVGKASIVPDQTRTLANDALNNLDTQTISKTFYIKNPEGNILKVTATGALPVSGSDIVEQGINVKDIPVLTKVELEAFKKNPSLYGQLKTWISGGDIKEIPFDMPKSEPAANAPESTTPNSPIFSQGNPVHDTLSFEINGHLNNGMSAPEVSRHLQIGLNAPESIANKLASDHAISKATNFVSQAKAAAQTDQEVKISSNENSPTTLSSEKSKELTSIMEKTGGFLTEKDISEIAHNFGNIAVTVKDVNGQRAQMSLNDFQQLSQHKGFNDRIRAVFMGGHSTNLDIKPRFDEGFMEALKPQKFLETGEKEKVQQPLDKIDGVQLTNKSSISKIQQEKYVDMVKNERIRELLKENGIKEVNIEVPYKFGLSEQAHLIKGKKIINISADATNPSQTILHELGHAKFEDLPKEKQNELIQRAKDTENPEMQGYKKNESWEEIVADSLYNDPNFAPEYSQIKLQGTLVPGLSEFVEKDIIPHAKGLIGGIKTAYTELARTLNPVGQAPMKGTDILMKHKGIFEQEMFNTEHAMKSLKTGWDKQPEKNRLDFMAKIESGAPLSASDNDIVELYRTRLDNAYKAISQYKDIPFLENFFPHFWEKPDEITHDAMLRMAAKAPLQGSRSFLKHRIFDTIKAGIDAGYKPVTTNPEELMQLYETNVKKFVMAQKIKEDMIKEGLWKMVKHGDKPPAGFSKIDDTIAKVYFPTETKSGSTILTSPGEYYAQSDVARLINNYLSKNFIMDTALGRGLMNLKNTLNVFQLGFSAFHITAETLNAIFSKFGIGLSQITQGKLLQGLGTLGASGTAPYDYYKNGKLLFDHANGKFDIIDPQMKKMFEDIFTGGASLRAKQYFKNSILESAIKNMHEGNYIGAALRAIPALAEASMRPIFNHIIPRIKVGAFMSLYANELERNASRIADGSLTQETIARNTWNSIENRMGELNYDNLFWNRNLKSAIMLGIRAPGWNLGTIREIGGGVIQDPLHQAFSQKGRADYKNHGYDFTPKMQYSIALLMVLGTTGAIYQYLHTGRLPGVNKKGKFTSVSDALLDMYYPHNGTVTSTGDNGRIELPTYFKDAYQASHTPFDMVKNKLAPEFTAIMDLLTNKDFYGNYIRNPHDNVSTQIKQMALYTMSQFEPFSVQQVIKQEQGTADAEQKIESFLGIVNAPASVVQSAYEQKLSEVYQEQRGAQGPMTPEQQAIAAQKSKAREDIKNGDYSSLTKLLQDGIITPRGMESFIRNSYLTSSQRLYNQLNQKRKAEAKKP